MQLCAAPSAAIEEDSFLTELLFEHLILGPEVLDHFLLLAVNPACDNDDIELPRLKREIHERSVVVKWAEMAFTIG